MGLDAKNAIENGKTALGIEFGSTRGQLISSPAAPEPVASNSPLA